MAYSVKFEIFRATFKSWEAMCEEVSAFATHVGPERLISITHSEDKGEGVIIVWHWADDAENEAESHG